MVWKNGPADNVTGAVRNDHCLPKHKLRVLFATCQWRRPPRSAGTRAMSQSAAVATRPRHGLDSYTLIHYILYTRSCITPPVWQSTGFRSAPLAGHMSGLINSGVSRRRSLTVGQARCSLTPPSG